MTGCGCARCAGGVAAMAPGRWRRQPEILDALLGRLREEAPLGALRARTLDDPSIALLDAWAVVLDILGFHSARIEEEGYLATARERWSLAELARLVGHAPRPGVAAGAWLAFEIDPNTPGPVELPEGLQVNSVPAPGETMVSFETSAPLPARAAWNAMPVRRGRPQTWEDAERHGLWLEGAALGLKPGDPMLVRHGPREAESEWKAEFRRVQAVEVDTAARRTRVVLAGTAAAVPMKRRGADRAALLDTLRGREEPSRGKDDPARPGDQAEAASPEESRRLLAGLEPAIAAALPGALGAYREEPTQVLEAWALRITAPLFAHAAPLRARFQPRAGAARAVEILTPQEWVLQDGSTTIPRLHGAAERLVLEGEHRILPGTWAVVETPRGLDRDVLRGGDTATHLVARVAERALEADGPAARTLSLGAFGIGGPATELALDRPWQDGPAAAEDRRSLAVYRAVRVHTGAEALPLAPVPIEGCVEGASIQLDGLFEGLEPGRVVVVAGTLCGLVDATGAPIEGIAAAEAARIAEVVHAPEPKRGDTAHTRLVLAAPLARRYARGATLVHGNVAAATHGATREAVLGGGDPAGPPQSFALRPPPLGHVAAPVASGAEPTLELRVEGVRWHRAERLAGQGPRARVYRLARDADGPALVAFGDGRDGARPPRGEGNITARWRDGIGPAGNLRPGALTLPVTRPNGLKGVTNPLPASGGAGPDAAEALRRRIPLGARALDRLVSVADYADFALNFAGVAKGAAAVLPSGGRQVLHVTVAPIGDGPLDPMGSLLANLRAAMRRLGDPDLALDVAPCTRLALRLRARLLLDPDHRLAEVAPAARAALEARLGFEAVELGQDLHRATAIAAVQSVPGVVAAAVDVFASVSADAAAAMLAGGPPPAGFDAAEDRLRVAPARRTGDRIAPAELCALLPGAPESCVIEEMRL